MYAIHGSEDWRPDPNAGCRTALLHHHCPPLSHCLYTQYHVPLKLACRQKTILAPAANRDDGLPEICPGGNNSETMQPEQSC